MDKAGYAFVVEQIKNMLGDVYCGSILTLIRFKYSSEKEWAETWQVIDFDDDHTTYFTSDWWEGQQDIEVVTCGQLQGIKDIKFEGSDMSMLEEQIYIHDEKLIQKNQEIMLLNEVINNLTFNIAFNEYLNTEKETIMYNRESNNQLILTNDGRIKRRADEIRERFVQAAKWNLRME